MISGIEQTHLIGPSWRPGQGGTLHSYDPGTGEEVWRGRAATEEQVDDSVGEARHAFRSWRDVGFDRRLTVAEAYGKLLQRDRAELAELISEEVGKPCWESKTEVDSMIAKIAISADAFRERCAESSRLAGEATSRTCFRPHGVVAVFGPFNFPGHIANGHIVPALLAGNTVVFKPSEQAPAVGARMVEIWREAGLPSGVLNLVQGGAATGEALSTHPGIDGLFFTGSHRTGMVLRKLFAETPEKILAMEMGGNNPLLVFDPEDLDAAALMVVQSAYLTAGQRCTCARRLVIPNTPHGDRLLENVMNLIGRIRVGPFTDRPEPFMGPVISHTAADTVLTAQAELQEKGGRLLVPATRLREGTGLLSPGLIDVTSVDHRDDREIFGPLLQVVRVSDFAEAMAEANATRFGLAAGLISRDRALWEEFQVEVRAGVVNWNQPLTGASSRAPFGGIGQSGNHRPSGYLAADYCSYGMAVMERERMGPTGNLPTGIDLE